MGPRKSPATWRKQDMLENERHNAKQRTEDDKENVNKWRLGVLKILVTRHGWHQSVETIVQFVEDVDILLDASQARVTADPVRFQALMDQYGIDLSTCDILREHIFDLAAHVNNRTSLNAKKLGLTLSRLGSHRATVQVMVQALRQQNAKPNTLRSPEIQYARAHLSQLASQKIYYQLMVLEGKVALALGDEKRAIALWTEAIDIVVKNANAMGAPTQYPPDPFELSSPWIELTRLHNKRRELTKALWAIEKGCEQDDPMSHFHAAEAAKRVTLYGDHEPTADWLYHMTKAATSGYQKAIHELAKFYAESGWKYLEDEPPDHVKPTPFDSYPPEGWVQSAKDSLGRLFGMQPKTQSPLTKAKPSDDVFLTAVFPHKAKDRYQLALQWLEVNHKYFYAPSFLFHAELLMQKELWSQADAPKSALNLKQERYTFASKADRDANKPISKPDDPTPLTEPPNPFYDLAKAKLSLREVFYAYEAHSRIAHARKTYATFRRQGLKDSLFEDGDDFLNEDRWFTSHRGQEQRSVMDLRDYERKWLRYPEVFEMYEDGLEGMYQRAKDLCDQQGWDMVDDEGGLLYRANARAAKVRTFSRQSDTDKKSRSRR